MVKPSQDNIIVVGDIHGYYDEFVCLLKSAGLVNDSLSWIGQGTKLIQMGDAIDRGPASMKVDALLDRLQTEAALAGGELVRLAGNHEIEIIMGNFFVSEMSKKDALKYQKKLISMVLDGKMKGAHHLQGLLFVHAGVTARLLNIFKLQLGVLTEAKVAALINSIFLNSVKHNFFKHPIFNISISRGGRDKYGGVFWEDLEDLYLSMPRSPIRQVVGHTMVDDIVVNVDKNIIAVDVGLQRSIQYLKIIDKKVEIITVEQKPFI
ncbi:Calcineurin-like phosphoesterase [Parelusimicrobium proximum]|uniref:metallophosphoesterase n=1 Tax=Parelusimicrobium proximum TaxID=3228953 RepID=UPI003D16F724